MTGVRSRDWSAREVVGDARDEFDACEWALVRVRKRGREHDVPLSGEQGRWSMMPWLKAERRSIAESETICLSISSCPRTPKGRERTHLDIERQLQVQITCPRLLDRHFEHLPRRAHRNRLEPPLRRILTQLPLLARSKVDVRPREEAEHGQHHVDAQFARRVELLVRPPGVQIDVPLLVGFDERVPRREGPVGGEADVLDSEEEGAQTSVRDEGPVV